MDSNIMIAHRLTAQEVLALLSEPAAAVLFDLEDFTVEGGYVICSSDGQMLTCQVPRRTAARSAGHRISLEFHDGGFRDGSGWFVSIRERVQAAEALAASDDGHVASPTDLVALRVSLDSVRASRFDPVEPSSATRPSIYDPEATS